MNEQILERLNNIEQLLAQQTDKLMSFREACEYADLSASQMYKYTHRGEIPHYKPNGKKLYFSKSDLDVWLKRNRIKTKSEIDQEAINHIGRNVRPQ
jgi:excisionase family DNA binding protein